jgi:uncharacterized protein YcbX
MSLHLQQLFTYPVKSAAVVPASQVTVDRFGFAWDRRWMVIKPSGQFVTQRSHPRLGLVRAAVGADHLELSAPGQPQLRIPLAAEHAVHRPATVWKDTVSAWDEGDAAADWFSGWLEEPVRLVRFPDDTVRQVNPERSPEFAQTAFADGYPVLLATDSSLNELNRRLAARGSSPVTMDRFRPNLVVTGTPLEPFAEDGWRRIRIGSVEFDVVKPCTRCVITTTDQPTATIPEPGEPLATLATFRRWEGQVIFAQNLVHRGHGTLKLGDPVTVLS